MINILKLMRIKNLLLVMFFQVVIRYAVIKPIFESSGAELQLPFYQFILLLISIMFILGGGYIINDYFDTRIDAINQPDQVIVGNRISRRLAITLHQVFSIIGIIIGLFLAWKTGKYQIGISFIVVVGLLWFYSSSYKRQFLLGNIIVSIVAGISILYVLMFESAVFMRVYSSIDDAKEVINFTWTYVLSYVFFFMIIMLILGIIKDQITEPGDRELECHTIPIVWGDKGGKIVVSLLICILLAYLGHIYYNGVFNYDSKLLSLRYILSLVVLPIISSLVLNLRSKINKDYLWSYRAAQIALLGGIFFPLFTNYCLVYLS